MIMKILFPIRNSPSKARCGRISAVCTKYIIFGGTGVWGSVPTQENLASQFLFPNSLVNWEQFANAI